MTLRQQSGHGESQDSLERGLALAHFIFPNRATAIAILIDALNKLKARSSQERKRAYWRDKFLKRSITRITRAEEDTLQWLIYFESDSHEKAQEGMGRASERDMVVRYVKTLIRLSTGMSSFYVNIATHRLLYRYTTSDAQKIYEMVADIYREADEYRRAKRLLMLKVESRFGNRIQHTTADRGEVRYELAENQATWRELVVGCLEMFTPWTTQDKCSLQHHSDASPGRVRELFHSNFEESDNQDKIEIARCHAFIDPLCSGHIVKALGLEQHWSKLGVPRFYMEPDQNLRPPSSRFPDAPLTAQERQTIADTLTAEGSRRKKVVVQELRLVVDGVEHARLQPQHSPGVCFHVPLGSQLLEVWTGDEQGPLLLCTHIISVPDATHAGRSGFTLTLKSGQSISIRALNELDGESVSCAITVSVDDSGADRRPVGSRAQGWLARAAALPAYAGMLVLLLAVVFLWTELRQKRATGQVHEDAVRTELARQREADPSAYRLTPDDLITRGSDQMQDHAIAVPRAPTVIDLELPVPKDEGKYSAALRPLDGRRTVIAEDELPPIRRDSNTIIVMSVPSNLLAPSQYYRVELRHRISEGVRTFTFYTTPAQPQ